MREGWEIKKLEQVSGFQNGFAFKSKTFKEEGIPVIRITNIQDQSIDFSQVVYVNPKDYDKDLTKYHIVKGDLLIAMSGATTGKIGINNSDNIALLNQRVGKFEPNEDLLKLFLYYFLSTKVEESLSISAGSAQPNLSTEQIKNFEIPFPPIEEQKEIVEILDQAFESIDKAKANIEKNIENAKELFQSKLNRIFSQAGEGWKEKKIIELCKHKSQIVGGPFGSNLKVKDYKEQGIPILRLQNIGKGYFIDKAIKYISEEKAKELSYHSFSAGDIALAKLGIPIGKTCIVPNKFKYGIVVADVVRIRPNKEQVNYDFLKHFLNSDCSVRQLTADIKGATRPRVNIAEVRNLKLSIPNIIKQKEIVETLDILDNHIQSILSSYKEELKNLEELKKSILQKAFNGELTNKNKAA